MVTKHQESMKQTNNSNRKRKGKKKISEKQNSTSKDEKRGLPIVEGTEQMFQFDPIRTPVRPAYGSGGI